MQTPTLIESTRNETVKRARALAAHKGREEQGLHFIEGELLIREAVVSGAVLSANAFIEQGHPLMQAVLEGKRRKRLRRHARRHGNARADEDAAMGLRDRTDPVA